MNYFFIFNKKNCYWVCLICIFVYFSTSTFGLAPSTDMSLLTSEEREIEADLDLFLEEFMEAQKGGPLNSSDQELLDRVISAKKAHQIVIRDRIENERWRQTLEVLQKKSDENKRQSDENKRQSDENKRKSDENKRKSDENKRKSDENKRQSDENARKVAQEAHQIALLSEANDGFTLKIDDLLKCVEEQTIEVEAQTLEIEQYCQQRREKSQYVQNLSDKFNKRLRNIQRRKQVLRQFQLNFHKELNDAQIDFSSASSLLNDLNDDSFNRPSLSFFLSSYETLNNVFCSLKSSYSHLKKMSESPCDLDLKFHSLQNLFIEKSTSFFNLRCSFERKRFDHRVRSITFITILILILVAYVISSAVLGLISPFMLSCLIFLCVVFTVTIVICVVIHCFLYRSYRKKVMSQLNIRSLVDSLTDTYQSVEELYDQLNEEYWQFQMEIQQFQVNESQLSNRTKSDINIFFIENRFQHFKIGFQLRKELKKIEKEIEDQGEQNLQIKIPDSESPFFTCQDVWIDQPQTLDLSFQSFMEVSA